MTSEVRITAYAIPGAAGDDSAPGTVLTTDSVGGDAIWIVLERSDDGMSYARVVPGRIAGTIAVHCSPGASPAETRVTVRYDLTSLGPDGAAFVEEFESSYARFLRSGAARSSRQAISRAARSPGEFTHVPRVNVSQQGVGVTVSRS
jgi:hypothetical protein